MPKDKLKDRKKTTRKAPREKKAKKTRDEWKRYSVQMTPDAS